MRVEMHECCKEETCVQQPCPAADECDPTDLGLGSARFLRNNGLDADFLAEITWNGKIDSGELRSHEQRIDELTYAALTGDSVPEPPATRTRRSRSLSPRRVNQAGLTLEDRMGPKARFRVRSCGWRPLRSLGQRDPAPKPLPKASRALSRVSPPPLGDGSESWVSMDTASRRGSGCGAMSEALPVFTSGVGSSPGSGSDENSLRISTVQARRVRFSPGVTSFEGAPPVPPVWGIPMSHFTGVAEPSPSPTPELAPQNCDEYSARSPTAQPCAVRLSQGGSVEEMPVWAWRYGRGGEWHSVRGCTIELQQGSLLVRRSGALQQALPCLSVTQALTYGSLGRLIVAASPGVDSMFLSLDKTVHKAIVAALATYGVSVSCVGYADFFALQKQLVFPAVPLYEAPRIVEKKPEPSPPKKTKPVKSPQPVRAPQGKVVEVAPELPPGGINSTMQDELSKQLEAIRSQQEQLARLEAQLLRLGAHPPPAAAP
eukprot:Hpha_TRINITY_DN14201_c0_g1::TRINITY_DN14201_c0_g1_i2::g.22681::m.22681